MKVLFSDFDGTLINETQPLSALNKEKMQKLMNCGHKMVICTGRNLQEFLKDQKKYQFPFDYLILNNGGQIVDNHYKTLFEKNIPHDTGVKILNHTISIRDMWSYYCDSHSTYAYINGATYNHAVNGDKLENFNFQKSYQETGDFRIICFHQDNQQIDITKQCVDFVRQYFSDDVEAYYNLHYVDIVPKGCSKGRAMIHLLSMLDHVDQVYAVGDSYNDLSMLKEADYGYTFVYAHDDIKSQTKYHVNYVYEVIDDMLGGKEK